MEEREFVEQVRSAGGRAFLVGGFVRDRLRGQKAKDRDYVVAGLPEPAFCSMFPAAKRVGRSFPVYLLPLDGQPCEVALARRERKSGHGYRGFSEEHGPSVTIEEDLFRRDTAMNSMALELPEGRLVDPYGGAEDIRAGRIRAVSRHFLEDPVRALRAARQAAELGYAIEDGTLELMRACREELAAEPTERIRGELRRALETGRPSVFFRSLHLAGLLETVFPELHRLVGKEQPVAFHPEGDAFEHAMLVTDRVAERTRERLGRSDDAHEAALLARFAALAHDLGKGTTPQHLLPHHYGHEKRGLDVLAAWNRRIAFPRRWAEAAAFAIRHHMRAPLLRHPGKIVDLLLALRRCPLGLGGFREVILADHGSLPGYLAQGEDILARLLRVSGRDAPAALRGKEIAEWIRAEQIRQYQAWAEEHGGDSR